MNSGSGAGRGEALGYTPVAITFHWVTLLLISAGFVLGWIFDDYKGATKVKLITYHKWIGVTVFLLVLGRSAWRLRHSPPPLPAATPRWQKIASELSHAGLYVLMFLIPVSGVLMSSAMGFPVKYLNLVPLPNLLAKNQPLSWMLMDVHELLTNMLLYLVGLHGAAALYHHFVQRDRVLLNMLGAKPPANG